MQNGIFCGFAAWWLPYLYLWAILWGVTMLLPRGLRPRLAVPMYMAVCGLHGLLFGTLYAPAQALLFGPVAVGQALVIAGAGSMLAAALVLITSDRTKARAAAIQGTLPALSLLALLIHALAG